METHKQIKLNATGETVTFTKTAADTDGEYLEFICFLPAGKKAAPPQHIHTFQKEYFECMEGELGIFNNNEKKILLPGQSEEVPKNTKHGWYAAGETDIRFKTIFKPALDIEWMLTETFASMNRNNSAKPSVVEICYIITQMNGQFYAADIPVFIQKMFFPIIVFMGKLFGLTKNVKPKN